MAACPQCGATGRLGTGRMQACGRCLGSRKSGGATCPGCGGSGLSSIEETTTCWKCLGYGTITDEGDPKPCPEPKPPTGGPPASGGRKGDKNRPDQERQRQQRNGQFHWQLAALIAGGVFLYVWRGDPAKTVLAAVAGAAAGAVVGRFYREIIGLAILGFAAFVVFKIASESANKANLTSMEPATAPIVSTKSGVPAPPPLPPPPPPPSAMDLAAGDFGANVSVFVESAPDGHDPTLAMGLGLEGALLKYPSSDGALALKAAIASKADASNAFRAVAGAIVRDHPSVREHEVARIASDTMVKKWYPLGGAVKVSGFDPFDSGGGIGVRVKPHPKGLQILEVYGEHSDVLEAGDIILRTDSESLAGLSFQEAVGHVRGAPDTTVSISIERDGTKLPKDFKLKRHQYKADAVAARMIGNVLYLRPRSSWDLAGHVLSALQKKQDIDVHAAILDLRSVSFLRDEDLRELAGLIGSDAVAGFTRNREGTLTAIKATGTAAKRPASMAILIDTETVQLAELLAAAFQAHGAAILVGCPTSGKNFKLDVIVRREYSFFFPIAARITPNKVDLTKDVVRPDIVVDDCTMRAEPRDRALAAALKRMNEPYWRQAVCRYLGKTSFAGTAGC